MNVTVSWQYSLLHFLSAINRLSALLLIGAGQVTLRHQNQLLLYGALNAAVELSDDSVKMFSDYQLDLTLEGVGKL